MLRQAPHKPIRHAKDLADFGNSRPRMEGVEPAHHRNMSRLVQTEDLFDNLILPVVGKIQIDVGEFFQCHAVAVQEPLEIQLEAHRADIADSQTKADQ